MTVAINCEDQKTVNHVCIDLARAQIELSGLKVADRDSERTKADVQITLTGISEKLDALGIKYIADYQRTYKAK